MCRPGGRTGHDPNPVLGCSSGDWKGLREDDNPLPIAGSAAVPSCAPTAAHRLAAGPAAALGARLPARWIQLATGR